MTNMTKMMMMMNNEQPKRAIAGSNESQNSTLLASKVEILSKVENNRPYSKYDRKIIGHLKK